MSDIINKKNPDNNHLKLVDEKTVKKNTKKAIVDQLIANKMRENLQRRKSSIQNIIMSNMNSDNE